MIPLSPASFLLIPLHQPEEQVTSDYLLKVFRVSIPGMPKTASKFAHELQSVLQQMLMKPAGPNWAAVSLNIRAFRRCSIRYVDIARNRRMHLQRCPKPHT